MNTLPKNTPRLMAKRVAYWLRRIPGRITPAELETEFVGAVTAVVPTLPEHPVKRAHAITNAMDRRAITIIETRLSGSGPRSPALFAPSPPQPMPTPVAVPAMPFVPRPQPCRIPKPATVKETIPRPPSVKATPPRPLPAIPTPPPRAASKRNRFGIPAAATMAAETTTAAPGTLAKLRTIFQRAKSGQAAFHPEDATA